MSNDQYLINLSKFLSLVLRHKPQTIGIELDSQGWTNVGILIEKMNENGKKIDFELLNEVVANNNKNRYAFNSDKSMIRASQGHSVEVELGYKPVIPPEVLYHGTADKFVESIQKLGLQKQNRHHVHLSLDIDTAVNVGKRHGKPLVFQVLAGQMYDAGYRFYVSDNGVWLTDEVPASFLEIIEL